MKNEITAQQIQDAINNTNTAAEAARLLDLHFTTFKRMAIKYGLYQTNQGSKGIKRQRGYVVSTEDILSNKKPFGTYKLKLRLIKEGIKEDKCELCGWNAKRPGEEYTPCELHHINGNHYDNSLTNLQMLCPNCHSLTPNYRAKNIK